MTFELVILVELLVICYGTNKFFILDYWMLVFGEVSDAIFISPFLHYFCA